MLLWYICLFLPYFSTASIQDGLCCSFASGSCRTACQQFSLAAIAADTDLRQRKLKVVKNFCSYSLVNFWQCMNETVSGIEKGQGWSGRHCCHIPHSGQCQRACVLASHPDQLTPSCRKSDELAFFSCLDRQELGENCCGQAKTSECLDSCKSIFFSHLSPKKEQREAVIENCEASSPKVASCVKNLTKVTPAPHAIKYLHCCDKTSKEQCKDSCKKHLKSKAALQEIVDNLQEGGCGPPLPHDEPWQCFLHSENAPETTRGNEVSRIDRAGMDSAKLHCCGRAVSSTCRRLCIKTFSDEWMRSWTDFDRACLSPLTEDRLQSCIDEVEEPCELGCDGLNYCSNFNNRPTELFRSCTPAADEAAQHDVAKWQQEGYLDLPGGLRLPLRNISRCSPDVWKTVACALQIKPCHRDSHENRICKEDCYETLTECMDWSRMPFGQTVSSLCALLSPGDKNSPCVSLKPFLEPSDMAYGSTEKQITASCKGDLCDSQELCTVNRNCEPGRPCQTYQCLPGCRLGEASWFVVPVGSYVRIPIQTEHKGCVKICQCTENRLIEKCQPLPCVPIEDCWLGNKKIEHGSTFYSDCNVCNCFAGEIICSKKQCKGTGRELRRTGWASLPCNCPPHYVPYCGRNGYTYPNACLAKCAGLRDGDFEFGACSSNDPCDGNPCGDDMKCVTTRKVCLSLLEDPCQQHMCIDPTENCSHQPRAPVCDTQQQEHPNMCYLARAGKELAYKGPCRTQCDAEETVCGIDGVTYSSKCAALSHFIAVDYMGSCDAVGLITDSAQPMCSTVTCPSLPHGGCLAVTPPGACCPLCAGALRFLFSRKQIDRALYALQGNPTDALSVEGLLEALQRQIQVMECSLRGYLTVELDLFIAVVAIPNASELQQEVCMREVEKLASLVQRSSPRFLSELGLSALTTATPIHIMAQSLASQLSISVAIFFLIFIIHVIR